MQWIEALINVSAFVGFVGVATLWPTIGPISKLSTSAHDPATDGGGK
jgi:hypothetical protein